MPMDMAQRGIKEGRVLSASNYAEFEGAHADLMKAAERIAMVLEACRPKAAPTAPTKIDPLAEIGHLTLEQFLAQFTAGAE
jgi:hypothetical protein